MSFKVISISTKCRIPHVHGGYLEHADFSNPLVTWVYNSIFEATLTYSWCDWRRSPTFWFKDSNGISYPMKSRTMDGVIPHMKNGVVKAKWTFAKKGQYYSLVLAEDANENG